MAQVKVRNLHTEDHVEKFRGKNIIIPAGGTIEMGRAEAVKFLGQWSPPAMDGAGRHLRPKKLKIEQDPEVFAEHRDQPLKFEAPDGKMFRTEQGLANHIEALKGGKAESDEPRRRRTAPKPAAGKDGAT